MLVHFLRLLVLNPMGGVGEKEKSAFLTIIHARARYQLSMAVSAPGRDQASLYSWISSLVNVWILPLPCMA
ncbi:MAG TPA: hypothetical protein VI524_03910 [Anaerolineales bacterium]|nr:hypothetical protein [Anaerolineales bacterium]